MANIGYDLDITGKLPANKVTEIRTVTKKAYDGRTFIIPKAAPFFAESVVIKADGAILVEDIDYQIILQSEELSHTIEQRICGGILFNSLAINKRVEVTLQTLGGDFNIPINNTLEDLARLIRNPTYTKWSQLVGTPAGLPTYDHLHDWNGVGDFSDLIEVLNRLGLILVDTGAGGGNEGSVQAALLNHIETKNGAHTPSAIGLGNVKNYALADAESYSVKPYPNDRYVTPRSVMFAIDLFIGESLKNITDAIAKINDNIDSTNTSQRGLLSNWNDLQNTLTTINNNYSTMQNVVAGYNESLNRIQQEYNNILNNQDEWLGTINSFNTSLTLIQRQYNDILQDRAQIMDSFNNMSNKYDEFVTLVETIRVELSRAEDRLSTIESHTIYPTDKIITAGSFHFRVAPNSRYAITLIGGGGGVGDYTESDKSLGRMYNGESGGDTTLHCLQDMTNGNPTPSMNPVASAGGGYPGQPSYGTAGGVVSTHGIGGRGGSYYVQSGVILSEASNGDGGLMGVGNFNKNVLSEQNTGYQYYGHMWGRGAVTERALGQGGEGAIVKIQISNPTNKDLEFMVVVGAPGKSYNPRRSTAGGGLAIINKINP